MSSGNLLKGEILAILFKKCLMKELSQIMSKNLSVALNMLGSPDSFIFKKKFGMKKRLSAPAGRGINQAATN